MISEAVLQGRTDTLQVRLSVLLQVRMDTLLLQVMVDTLLQVRFSAAATSEDGHAASEVIRSGASEDGPAARTDGILLCCKSKDPLYCKRRLMRCCK